MVDGAAPARAAGLDGRLWPALDRFVATSLGWPALREVQRESIGPVLAGLDVLITAGTAAGKTEAAALPLLTRLAQHPTARAVWLCPTRALASQLAERLGALAAAAGVGVALRHSDVSHAERERQLREPPRLWVTTPESIEAMFVARVVDRAMPMMAMVVDEFHAFVASTRGLHIEALLARVEARQGRRVQRIGLSATLGEPAAAWQRFAGPGSPGLAVVQGPPKLRDRRLVLEAFESDADRLDALAPALRERATLLFARSRRVVDQTTFALTERGVAAVAHHGSLDGSRRSAVEQRLRAGEPLAVVCTSTLEMGIDIGDLEQVAMVGAPPTVSSFVQRVGRAGRRAQQVPTVYVCTRGERDTRLGWASVELAMRGWVEPVSPPPAPPVLWHQLLAMAVADDGLRAVDAWATLRRAAVWQDLTHPEIEGLLREMQSAGWLDWVADRWVLGDRATRRFGAPGYAGLCATFADDRRERRLEFDGDALGVVDVAVSAGDVVWMDGRAWEVESVDGDCVLVRPGDAGAAARLAKQAPKQTPGAVLTGPVWTGPVWTGAAFVPHPTVAELAHTGPTSATRPGWVGERAWAMLRP